MTVGSTRCQGSELIGRRYRAAVRLLLQDAGRHEGRTARTAATQHVAWRVVAGRFRHDRQRHRRRPSGAGLRRSRLRRAASTSRRGSSTGEGPQLICAVGPDGKFTAEAPDYRRPLGQGLRQGHHPRPEAARAAVPPGAIPARLSVLLAGRRRSADPVSAARAGSSARRSSRTQMLANNAQINWLPEHIKRRPLRQLPGNERRLGPLARALLGHAAADLGLRADRQDGSRRQLRRTARQARRHAAPKSGKQAKRSQSRAVRRSEGPQAVHRRGHLRLAVRRRRARMRRVPR